MDLVEGLKSEARTLHKQIESKEPAALARARKLRELSKLSDDELVAEIKRRHCLAVVARELGFEGWSHATAIFAGKPAEDHGTLLYPDRGAAYWNIWSADYEEARRIREEHGGWLLAYRKHFFITDRYFIEHLGLDPEDPDWAMIGRDWARPADPAARTRLYAKLITARRGAGSASGTRTP